MPNFVRIKPTFKEKRFAEEYVKQNGNGTQAALAVYNTTDKKTASVISAENLVKPRVQQTIEEIATAAGVSSQGILQNISKLATQQAEKVSAEAILKANIELAKLLRLYPDKKSTHVSLNVTAKFKGMDYSRAKEELGKLSGEAKTFVSEADD